MMNAPSTNVNDSQPSQSKTSDGKTMANPESQTHSAIGTHLLADLHGIDPQLLQDENALEALLESSLVDNGYNILNLCVHKFQSGGFGVTGIALLSESHASFHSYPELGYLAFDLFSCGDSDPNAVLDQWKRSLRPKNVSLNRQIRG